MAAVVPFRIGKKVFGNVTAVMSPFTCLHETEVDTIRSGWLNVTRVFLRRENDLSKLSSHDQSSNTLPAKHAVGQSTSGSSVRHLREVMYCDACSLGQLKEIVPPMEMFSEYSFYSSVMAPIVDRAEKLVGSVIAEKRPRFVIEVGSNDGYLLHFYRKTGVPVLGVDVARGPANEAALKGVPTVQELFSLQVAKTLPKADIVHANNVLAHCPDVNDVVAGF